MPNICGKDSAAGAVVVEADGRIWVIAPTNGYGGYLRTFPKGRLNGMSPHGTAVKEVFEETGLRVELTGYLCDAIRSVTIARYYLARRLGGSPAAMGWESQAVLLVPPVQLSKVLQHPNDKAILAALQP